MPRKTKNEEFRAWVKFYKTYILSVPIKGDILCEFSVVAYDFIEAQKIAMKAYPDAKQDKIKCVGSYKNL